MGYNCDSVTVKGSKKEMEMKKRRIIKPEKFKYALKISLKYVYLKDDNEKLL